MVIVSNPTQYRLVGFELSHQIHKKYDALLEHKQTKRIKRIPFGDQRYQHYHDQIGHYRHLDHYDKDRRRRYRLRHAGENKHLYSSGYFSWKYLW